MKSAYPIILSPADKGFVVYVPDLDINTEGDTIADAIEMARDAIGLWGICRQDTGNEIPIPKSMTPKHKSDEIVSIVDVDFDFYRRVNEMRTVRKNVTIPSWLNELAEKNKINFSAALQEGLKHQLNITE
ncbi:type II toxin-antitoxin system HicB family antitoxin [Acetivibrio sp. MSJd-27]|uniref:type II toxin-antitoxin system HicB family antitoxin n=1 Tax=Acetivibrio sp. MSJd-27 TaxID=2841523 RepID=UPI001C0F91AC|nr:type II toxin-antitoxin system HicB family antitoxin [Acetivibrio sp. MSJd-27]MBU5451291.1 type II toxin-antitoxin system HicB family antitoxin [Acetivibrio sp. MSJd-27]